MSSSRSSRRLAGKDPPAEQLAKRTPKLNTNSLEKISAGQPPIQRPGLKKKRGRAITASNSPDESPQGVRQRVVQEKNTGNSLPDTTPPASSPQLIVSSPAIRTKLPFDPTTELEKKPQNVLLAITPVIDDKRQSVVVISYNINQWSRLDWDGLCEEVWRKKIQEWSDVRKQRVGEKPVLRKWKIHFGTGKNAFELQATCNETWKDTEIMLRSLTQGNSKPPSRLLIDALYRCPGRPQSLVSPANQSTKEKDNSRPETARRVRLDSPSDHELPYDPFDNTGTELEDNTIEEEATTSLTK